jgi:hypothetical protein
MDCKALRATQTWTFLRRLMHVRQQDLPAHKRICEWTFNYNNYQTMQDAVGLGLGVSSAFVTWRTEDLLNDNEIS